MNNLKVGFAEVVITPPMGINISGYFQTRLADGVLDDLYTQAIAFSSGEKTTVMLTVDLIGLKQYDVKTFKDFISKETGLAPEAIFITCSHTHTGPTVNTAPAFATDLILEYFEVLKYKFRDVVMFALADLKPARLGYGIGSAPRIAFIRRYRMKNGKVRTNPGVNNPEILAPIGETDERVNVIRIDREGADGVVIVNFGVHPDVVGGCKISSDYIGFLRNTVRSALGNVRCVFANGAQGDVNHVNVFPRPGESNGMFHDFDDVDRGYPHSRHMGNVLAGAVLQVYEKVKYVDVDSINYGETIVEIPANLPDASEIEISIKYNNLHKEGRDDEIPFKGMELTTELARAARVVRLLNGPDHFDVPVSAFRLGKIAFVGFGGEPFTDIGKGVKLNDNYELVCPCALTNGHEGYFPVMNAYTEGGYESATSNFKAGVAELLIEKGIELSNSIK